MVKPLTVIYHMIAFHGFEVFIVISHIVAFLRFWNFLKVYFPSPCFLILVLRFLAVLYGYPCIIYIYVHAYKYKYTYKIYVVNVNIYIHSILQPGSYTSPILHWYPYTIYIYANIYLYDIKIVIYIHIIITTFHFDA